MRQFLETMGTNVLSLKDGDVLRAVTKDAGRLILFQHDGRPVYVDFQGITLCNVEGAAQFDGEDDPSQFVYPAYDTCGLHVAHPFLAGAVPFCV